MELPANQQLRIEPWPDPVIDQLGFPPYSPYLELWLGILGPTLCWTWRRLGTRLEREPDGFDVDLVEMARLLGLGTGVGPNSPLWRTLERAVRFDVAHWREDKTVLAVRRRIPPLPRRHLVRLPAVAQRAHEAWMTRPPVGVGATRAAG